MTTVSAAHVLDLSEHQVPRLLERMPIGCGIDPSQGGRQPSNKWISDGVRDYAVTLVGERYANFGPTLAAEKRSTIAAVHPARSNQLDAAWSGLPYSRDH